MSRQSQMDDGCSSCRPEGPSGNRHVGEILLPCVWVLGVTSVCASKCCNAEEEEAILCFVARLVLVLC